MLRGDDAARLEFVSNISVRGNPKLTETLCFSRAGMPAYLWQSGGATLEAADPHTSGHLRHRTNNFFVYT